jgi:hypothetical protein
VKSSPSTPSRRTLHIDDGNGRRLYLAWSRSGKRLGVAVTTPRYSPFAQVGLSAGQVEALARFLVETGPPDSLALKAEERALRFDDPDEKGELRAAWTRSVNA